MAPQTTIGSSTPVGSGGENLPEDLREKAVELSATAPGLPANTRRKSPTWASAPCATATTGTTAKRSRKTSSTCAPSLDVLLDEIDGMKTKPKGIVLNTAGAEVTETTMGLWQQILDLLIDPNVVYIMLSIGLIGIIVELWNPGLIFPGTVGAISR